MKTWQRAGLALLLGGGLLAGGWAALTPLPADTALPREQWNAGPGTRLPAYAGLSGAFPPQNAPPDNATTPAKAELGRLLFFDPVLSRGEELACASCHQPALGFSDGRQTARGAGGAALPRHTLSLWNAGYVASLLWNGGASSLESVAAATLTAPDEFGSTPAEVTAKLEAIPEYRERFAAAFGPGPDAVSAGNTARALAAFLRTLVSRASPYDRFAAGDFAALTPAQRRGLALFRSPRTHCNDCHSAPTFADNGFSVTGVLPWPGQAVDRGRAAVDPLAAVGAFKAPTLRNIALTAPYMHNGRFATLGEVVDFYAQGGGRPEGVTAIAGQLTGFTLTPAERADLIAFLYALTDESAWAGPPAQVPSGLPVIAAAPNPGRLEAEQINAPAARADRAPQVWTVTAGESVQAVVDRARSGDTVLIPYGVYHEAVIIDEPGLRLLGVPDAAGARPVLDGAGQLAAGLTVTGDGFELAELRVQGYTAAGVRVRQAAAVNVHDIDLAGGGDFGLALERCRQVQVTRVTAAGLAEAGLYLTSSEAVTVTAVTAVDNAMGIRLENSVDVLIQTSELRANALGLGLLVFPHLPARAAAGLRVQANRLLENNRPGFQSGTGLLVLGADDVTIAGNTFSGQTAAGVVVRALTPAEAGGRVDVGTRPDDVTVRGNTYAANRLDLVWDGTGQGNDFAEPGARAAPALLPGPGWPAALYTLYARWLALH